MKKDFQVPVALHDLTCICFYCKNRAARAEKYASEGGGRLRKQMQAEMERERLLKEHKK